MNERTLGQAARREKVQARIGWVRRELAAQDSNLALLQAFSQGRVTFKGKGYTRGAENYRQTVEDKARLPRTLANLQAQRERLLQELAILLEYGA